jgi:hypothetical protein
VADARRTQQNGAKNREKDGDTAHVFNGHCFSPGRKVVTLSGAIFLLTNIYPSQFDNIPNTTLGMFRPP